MRRRSVIFAGALLWTARGEALGQPARASVAEWQRYLAALNRSFAELAVDDLRSGARRAVARDGGDWERVAPLLEQIVLQPFRDRLSTRLLMIAESFSRRFTAADLREMERLGSTDELQRSPEAARFRQALSEAYGAFARDFPREISQWLPGLWDELNRRLVSEGMRPIRLELGRN